MSYHLHKLVRIVTVFIWHILLIATLSGMLYIYRGSLLPMAQQGIAMISPFIEQIQDYIVTRIYSNRDMQGELLETPVSTSTPDTITSTPDTITSVTDTPNIYVTVTQVSNIRILPDRNSTKIGIAKPGDKLMVLAQNATGSWYKVRFDESIAQQSVINSVDATGWINSALVTSPTGILPVVNEVISTIVKPAASPTPQARLVVRGKNDPDVRRDPQGNILICVSLQIRNRNANNWTFSLDGVSKVATFTQVQGADVADAAVCEGVDFLDYTMRIYDETGSLVPGGEATVTGGFIYEAIWVEQ